MEALLGRFDGDRAQRDRQHGALRDLLAQEKGERDSHHASIQERVVNLEGTLGSGLDKHAKEIAATKDAHAQLLSDSRARAAHHGTLADRVDKLEKAVADTGCRYDKELKMASASVEAVNRRLNMIKEVWSEDTPRVPGKGF
uniref:Uncharacterized protein n=1 Tax=Alexandrium catenella TaxID=2925 RepID=A0A7S1Q4H4_ALECA|mmetsp:Transcript_17928/g.48788  ORF Transcript_17928/g.48788 Transcript_17928/m.48788 type:complete len:142 (+) Transcript_17928:2-427(+)